jgi:hypothetical protein
MRSTFPLVLAALATASSCSFQSDARSLNRVEDGPAESERAVALPKASSVRWGVVEFYNHPFGSPEGGPFPNREPMKLSPKACEAALAEIERFGDLVTREEPQWPGFELGSLRLVDDVGTSTRICWFFTGGKNELLLTIGGRWVCAATRTIEEGEECLSLDARMRKRFAEPSMPAQDG